jgi:tRNA-splicing ligase RtcB
MTNDYSKMNVYRHNNNHIITGAKFPVKEWTIGVEVEEEARKQLFNVASMPFIYKYISAMPDVHLGMGATIGSVIPTIKAVMPAAVGSDIGCGVAGIQTTLKASHLPHNLFDTRMEIEKAIPHGRTDNGGPNDIGAWQDIPASVEIAWAELEPEYNELCKKHPGLLTKTHPKKHLGTLGSSSSNHFCEVCIDENQDVWLTIHSGSRGVGSRIGSYFLDLAKKEAEKWYFKDYLPDINLAFLPEDSLYFEDYIRAVNWAQKFASKNREIMIENTVKALRNCNGIPKFETKGPFINNHHNYVAKECHFGRNVWVTRKGAVRARRGDLSVIPGSMCAKTFIVNGLGNEESFCSASHGAGRKMSRTEARKTFTVEDHRAAVAGVECRVDEGIIDETPGSYKDIELVMEAQKDLVEIVHTLKQVICVKG